MLENTNDSACMFPTLTLPYYDAGISFSFLRATAGTAIARLSRRNSVRLSVCLSVRPSHGWISQKWCKLGSPNLYRRCPEDSSFRNRKAFL